MLKIEQYFLCFMIYSMIGWLMEVIVTFVEDKKFVNRGFLIGPYCPIYGWGYLAITILLTKYKTHPVALFVLISVVCSVIEYVTSLVLEKLFHARWWDYSKRLLNVDGRICIANSVAFGALGIVALMYLNPVIEGFIFNINPQLTMIIAIIVFIIYLVDNITSFKIVNSFKNKFASFTDNTEEIKEKTLKFFNSKPLTRRIKEAFPNLKPIVSKIKKIKK